MAENKEISVGKEVLTSLFGPKVMISQTIPRLNHCWEDPGPIPRLYHGWEDPKVMISR
jgi:hypothetical protein